MKLKIFLLLLIPITVIANEADCDQEDNLSKLAKGITYPNCNTPSRVMELKARKSDSLCNACKTEFEIVHGSKIVENKSHLQEAFFKSSMNEYKKNITNNLLNAVKVKSLYPTGSDLKKSITACKMKSASDFIDKDCSSPAAVKLLSNPAFFESLSVELGNDVSKFLSRQPGYNPKPTVLTRTPQSCDIPESDILLYASATFEEALDPKMIEFFKKIDATKYNSVSDLLNSDEFVENFGDSSDLKVSLGNHPYLSVHVGSTANFINFMKKIPAPEGTKNLRDILYSKNNGDDFDKNLADSCNKSFRALKDSICSKEFEAGQLFVDPNENFSKLGLPFPTEDNFASNESLIDTNIKLLEMCENKNSSSKKDLTKINKDIGFSVQEEQRPMSLDLFKASKYNSEIGSLTTSLCEMTDKNCIAGTLTCAVYQKYKALKDQSKPGNFANKEVNELIRVMIGDTTKLSPQTKQVLIAEGIIPKEDGKLIEKPEIPETQEQFFAKVPAQKINPGSGQTKTATNFTSGQSSSAPSVNNSISNSSNSVAQTAPAGNMDDISDLVRGSTEDIKDIQDEIKRRLGNLPQSKPATIEDAKKIARDTFKSKGRKITPYQEQALADRMLQPQAPNSVSATNNNTTNANSPSVSNTATQSEKFQAGLKDKALMGMQGAQNVLANEATNGRGPASVGGEKPKDLTKVALNIAEDPKVKLSDIFASKIDQNDPETQLLKVLLKSKNNFLLQIKDMNFKVVFDGNNFNVLLESGDRAEAERMRPQLEIFLKRLKT